ncbi:cytochrome P450 [Actinoalloteichus sp. AHMU CJ021]|uniref:cytochrome P450 n=1 Tax=Actinoalloteichus TaxID=65496 RepID=UPI00069089FB|nr:cytochrome P450 [Actinoalloteichus caeruleus]AUS77051.1 cytochrome P450 [Actinoalloteichus sp. AHMU CJ021]
MRGFRLAGPEDIDTQEDAVALGDADQKLDYPIPAPAALEPPTEWTELRGRCPVAPVTLPSGDTASLLTRYDDVRQVLSDPRFTRHLNAPDAARIAANESGGVFNGALASAMPEETHQQWRRLVGKWFTAKRMTQLRPGIEAMTDRLVDAMLEHGAPADLRSMVGFPLPVWVICDMLGVPEADRDRFAYWSNTLLSLTRYEQDEIDAAQAEFRAYMVGHIATTRENLGEDLISELIATAETHGHVMPDEALLATAQGLLVAGHETTSNMIGKMVGMLLVDRGRWEALVADPSLVRTAVEELLRMDANGGFGIPRYITEDAEVGGTLVPRGTTVVCNLSAANRDERVFPDAHQLDLTRSPNTHLAFGAGGHSCLGQSLARTELQAVLSVLLRRLPTLELAVAPEDLARVEGLVVGGLQELPVRW